MNEVISNQNVNNNNLSEALMENVQVVKNTVAVMLDGSPMSQEAFRALEVHPQEELSNTSIEAISALCILELRSK